MSKEVIQLADKFLHISKMFPEVVYAGDPVLRTETERVSTEEGIEIGKTLGKILLRYRGVAGYGRGLAAPQIGIRKAVYVTFVNDQLNTVINPVIEEKSNSTNFYRELCLSSGILSADVERPDAIVLSFDNETGERVKQEYDGFLARLHQHEEAHLRGVLNLDEAVTGGIEFATFDPLKETLRTSR